MADFIADAAPELLVYAKQLEERNESSTGGMEEADIPSNEELALLLAKAKARASQRLKWFQGSEGTNLRLLYDQRCNLTSCCIC